MNILLVEFPEFNEQDITSIIELDNATAQSQHGELSAVPDWLKIKDDDKELFDELLNSPSNLNLKKSPKEWLEDQIESIVTDFFMARKEVEVNLTRDELIAFDKDMIKEFSKEKLFKKLRQNLSNERKMINLIIESADVDKNKEKNEEMMLNRKNNKLTKLRNNNSVKNEESYYKMIAYQSRLEKDLDEQGVKTKYQSNAYNLPVTLLI